MTVIRTAPSRAVTLREIDASIHAHRSRARRAGPVLWPIHAGLRCSTSEATPGLKLPW